LKGGKIDGFNAYQHGRRFALAATQELDRLKTSKLQCQAEA
jgi:hypothetical protein